MPRTHLGSCLPQYAARRTPGTPDATLLALQALRADGTLGRTEASWLLYLHLRAVERGAVVVTP